MFFNLSRIEDPKFPKRYRLGRLVLNTDEGWRYQTNGDREWIYKGYADEVCLDDNLLDLSDHPQMGNYCLFEHDRGSGQIFVKTSRYRPFPLWYDHDNLTNLVRKDHTVYADGGASVDQDLSLTWTQLDPVGSIDVSPISSTDLLDQIHERLHRRTASFLEHNRSPIRIFCSGGIDTMLVFSYIKSHTDDFQMVFGNHVEWDEFWCRNQKHLRTNFWGYQQIHHWRDPCVLSSGAPGDEFTLRSPTTSNLWCKYHGTSIPEQLSKRSLDDCLHYGYFNHPKNLEIFRKQESQTDILDLDRSRFFWNLCNILVNDFQHWHLGNTLTWTPLRDLEIFKMFLRLPLQDGLSQIMDSSISRELIGRNDPTLLDHLSDTKNVGEALSRMPGLMSRYSATSGQ